MVQTNEPMNQPTTCRVLSEYQSMYPDPIVLCAGAEVAIEERESEWPGWIWCTVPEGKSGWVPEGYLQRHGGTATALCDYDATELTVRAGETVMATTRVAGWRWCTNGDGKSGWVPDEHLACGA